MNNPRATQKPQGRIPLTSAVRTKTSTAAPSRTSHPSNLTLIPPRQLKADIRGLQDDTCPHSHRPSLSTASLSAPILSKQVSPKIERRGMVDGRGKTAHAPRRAPPHWLIRWRVDHRTSGVYVTF